MGLVEIFVIAVGLSMDAFAVSVCKGLGMRRIDWRYGLLLAVFFGAFQALMPLLGYFLGTQFASYVEPIDHWIAFVLLSAIGAKMIYDGARGEADEEGQDTGRKGLGELLMLAIATSIDAFAVGCTLAFISVNIWEAVAVIGLTTFALSLIGVALGNKVGTRYNRGAAIFGGVVLIVIGAKTLLEHLGIVTL